MFRNFLKSSYYRSVGLMGLHRSRLKDLKAQNGLAIFNLHRVSPVKNDFWPPLDPYLFDRFLTFVTTHFQVVTFDDLSDHSLEKPPAIISFDDGYYDFVEFAVPLLNKHGVRANMNVIPECVLSGKPIWNVILYDFLNSASRECINDLKIPGFDFKIYEETRNARLGFGLKLSRFMKNRPRMERQDIWKFIQPGLELAPGSSTRMMSVEDIKEVAEIVDVGVHSYSHESMEYEDLAFFREDCQKCIDFFKMELNMPLYTYAFPNGSYREENVDLLRALGFKKILLVGDKFADPTSDLLTRITIYGDTVHEVNMRSVML